LIVLVCSYCSIYQLDYGQELDTVPEFVQLTSSPISRGLLSMISLQLRTREEMSSPTETGFGKVMAMINLLIKDNRRQLQSIVQINHRVEGQCLVSMNTLKNRASNFKSLSEYFKLKTNNALREKSESLNMKNSRLAHAASYSATLVRMKRKFLHDHKQWKDRISTANSAIEKTDSALKLVKEWKPNTPNALIEKSIVEAIELYQNVNHFPLDYDSAFVELAANDLKVRRRLYQWLNLLKATLVNSLSFAHTSKIEVAKFFQDLESLINQIIKLLNQDSKRLDHIIQNVTSLLKSYGGNEEIYTGLLRETRLVIDANKNWCKIEMDNFKGSKERMSEQLKIFVELKHWFRSNYGKVRAWIAKKY